MKVGTDGVLWVHGLKVGRRMLDIGSGTGLDLAHDGAAFSRSSGLGHRY